MYGINIVIYEDGGIPNRLDTDVHSAAGDSENENSVVTAVVVTVLR